mmetsp:Transcript_24032/g.77162  ORF Transcript_24032/g.77162 Transcript_24032/m.77162 type:complete len:325 (+) Transcript_24032:1279-2253(+)
MERFITITFLASHTCSTGMPAMIELGSSMAAELTVSLAPTTRQMSVSLKSSLISSISSTMSYGTPASASSTLSCPGMRPATGWMAKRRLTPWARSSFAISAIAYCPFATARPYPGTTITSLAALRFSTVASTSVKVASPSKTIASPLPVAEVPYPPSSTDTMSRFIATHMMCVRMAPDEPMRAPTVVRIGLSSMKPSAQSAHPEYEFSTVMTTGMSAPPMEAVMCSPSPPESTPIPASANMPAAGWEWPIVMSRPIIATVPAPAAMLIWSRCSSCSGAEGRLPFSLPKAITEPVVVTPPMTDASAIDVSLTPSSISGEWAACSR